MSKPQKRTIVVTKGLNGGAAATFENFLLTQMVPLVQDAFGVNAEDCTIQKFRDARIVIWWDPKTNEWFIKSPVSFTGVWTAE